MKGQLNFNTVLIMVVGGLITFGIKKLDENNTQLTRVGMSQGFISEQVKEIQTQMKDMVLKSDFNAEVARLNREIQAMRNAKPL